MDWTHSHEGTASGHSSRSRTTVHNRQDKRPAQRTAANAENASTSGRRSHMESRTDFEPHEPSPLLNRRLPGIGASAESRPLHQSHILNSVPPPGGGGSGQSSQGGEHLAARKGRSFNAEWDDPPSPFSMIERASSSVPQTDRRKSLPPFGFVSEGPSTPIQRNEASANSDDSSEASQLHHMRDRGRESVPKGDRAILRSLALPPSRSRRPLDPIPHRSSLSPLGFDEETETHLDGFRDSGVGSSLSSGSCRRMSGSALDDELRSTLRMLAAEDIGDAAFELTDEELLKLYSNVNAPPSTNHASLQNSAATTSIPPSTSSSSPSAVLGPFDPYRPFGTATSLRPRALERPSAARIRTADEIRASLGTRPGVRPPLDGPSSAESYASSISSAAGGIASRSDVVTHEGGSPKRLRSSPSPASRGLRREDEREVVVLDSPGPPPPPRNGGPSRAVVIIDDSDDEVQFITHGRPAASNQQPVQLTHLPRGGTARPPSRALEEEDARLAQRLQADEAREFEARELDSFIALHLQREQEALLRRQGAVAARRAAMALVAAGGVQNARRRRAAGVAAANTVAAASRTASANANANVAAVGNLLAAAAAQNQRRALAAAAAERRAAAAAQATPFEIQMESLRERAMEGDGDAAEMLALLESDMAGVPAGAMRYPPPPLPFEAETAYWDDEGVRVGPYGDRLRGIAERVGVGGWIPPGWGDVELDDEALSQALRSGVFGRPQAVAGDDVPEGASFEHLLELTERVGPALQTGASEREIEGLPRRTLGRGDVQVLDDQEAPRCAICLEAYRAGERVIEVRCKHIFHPECGAEWFRRSRKCPTCREDVTRKLI